MQLEPLLLFADANSPRKGQHAKVIVKMNSLEDGAKSPPEMRKTSDPEYVQEKEHVIVMENANEKNHNGVIKEQTLQVPRKNLRKSRTTLDADMENTSSRHFNGVPKIEQVHKI
ncbi:unnamed protein product [Lupinus luteus]|uniref:Uncharacterized protein n=1 Tax=Lupinus luteus TaxID=3873 RepID=A0AAV1X5J1_LUPLU